MILAGLLPAVGALAGVRHTVNADNGLRGWEFSAGDVQIELIQRLPDQTRALFMNHAFTRAVIEQLAQSCMFQTIIRNTGASGSGQAVGIDLAQWRMQHAGKTTGILLKEPLLDSWSAADASDAAKLVVRWGMFPTTQEYLPSDYNWGLTAYGIAPGSTFDLEVTWTEGDVAHRATIENIVCAPDVERLQ
ncbi:MAG: hypothetical protein R3F42_06220 [Pseudomonadota bacterium]